MHRYKDLEIWKLSRKFCTPIYKVTQKFPDSERFGLVTQLRKAAVSVPSNIAEGSAKSSNKHFLIFLENSLGSCYEMETQLFVSNDVGFLNESDLQVLTEELQKIILMISKFMSTLK
jgi:four helix bundle protein